MSADELRQAALTLRENAETMAPAAPWGAILAEGRHHEVRNTDGSRIATATGGTGAAYIATMHPGVGLELAAWLDDIAAGWMWDGEEPNVYDLDGDRLTFEESLDTHALKIARLINGGAA